MIRVRLAFAGLLWPLLAAPAGADAAPHAATLYAGVVTKETWEDALLAPWVAELEDGGLAVAGASTRLGAVGLGGFGALEWEAEALMERHWGAQDHWALSLVPAVARWRAPGGAPVSAAFGLGLSAASEVPRAERVTQGGSSAVMTYWAIDLELGPLPGTALSLAARLHHRSTAYGLFGEAGGSNAMILGLRRRFRRAPCTKPSDRGERGSDRRSPPCSARCQTSSPASASSPRRASRSSMRGCRGRRRTSSPSPCSCWRR
jgi:hypothetical protein